MQNCRHGLMSCDTSRRLATVAERAGGLSLGTLPADDGSVDHLAHTHTLLATPHHTSTNVRTHPNYVWGLHSEDVE